MKKRPQLKTKPAIITKEAKIIAERIIYETKQEQRLENLRLALEFEYKHLEEESIKRQERMFERKGFKVKDIRELRERIESGELKTTEEVGKELQKLKEKERLKKVIKNKGEFERQK